MDKRNKEKAFPIVYSSQYDITLGGLEKIHPFDSCKWRKVVNFLFEKGNNLITRDNIFEPGEVTLDDLKIGHSETYLNSLKMSFNVAKIVEVPFVAIIPNCLVYTRLLKRFRYHVQGIILASELALKHQWAINIGGGFHHASKNKGGGFCVYADISIAIKKLKIQYPKYKYMIIDLDAHQGNGHETDFMEDVDVFIFDMFNHGIYPYDERAKRGINEIVGLSSYTKDDEYLNLLRRHIDICFDKFTPNLIIYNAGTDCLLGDPLGRLSITDRGIVARDEIVFSKARAENCPIVMVTSGGYQMNNAEIIANSIWNLIEKKIITEINHNNT